MRVARVIAGAQLDRADSKAFQFLQYVVQGKLRQ
jgi:hypothetical protein